VLAGSALDMAGAVRNATASLGIAFDEAARMASAYPADFLGIANATGRIAPGLRADFVVLDDTLRVSDVFGGGVRALDR
jgi:N-acetylglucosamine-6-phosphate deacetylase